MMTLDFKECRNIAFAMSRFMFFEVLRCLNKYEFLTDILVLLNLLIFCISFVYDNRLFSAVILSLEISTVFFKYVLNIYRLKVNYNNIHPMMNKWSKKTVVRVNESNNFGNKLFCKYICNYSTAFRKVYYSYKKDLKRKTIIINIQKKFLSEKMLLQIICIEENKNIKGFRKESEKSSNYLITWLPDENNKSECYKKLKINYHRLFFKYYINVYNQNSIFNHIEKDYYNGSKEIYGFTAYLVNLLFGLNYYLGISKNTNEEMPPCTLKERLQYIDKNVPTKNKTSKQLNTYLKYIAHLHHNVPCKYEIITKERKARWLKHVNWVVSSEAIEPVNDFKIDYESFQTIKPVYDPQEEEFEVKTALYVNYTEGKEIVKSTRVTTKTEKKHIFDFDYEIVSHKKKNLFNVKDLTTGRCLTKKIPYFDDYYHDPEDKNIFLCEETGRKHSLMKDETIRIVKKEIEKTEPTVTFNEVSYKVPIKSDIKQISKAEYDKQWKTVGIRKMTEYFKEQKDKVVFKNRFSVLTPDKKLDKRLHFKVSNNIKMTNEDRDFCRYNRPTKKSKGKQVTLKKPKEIKVKQLIENKLKEEIREFFKENYKEKMRSFRKGIDLDLEKIIIGLEKGFFGKREFNYKKSIRIATFDFFVKKCIKKVGTKRAVKARTIDDLFADFMTDY